jgi:flagellar biosynthesis protein FlhF
MEVYTFRAESLQAALQQVRHSLGPDASVLNTRELRRSRLGIFSKTMVEVEATLDVAVVSRFSEAAKRPSSTVAQLPSHPRLEQNAATTQAASSSWSRSEAATSAVPHSANSLPGSNSRHAGMEAGDLSGTLNSQGDFRAPARDSGRMSPAMFEVLSELLDGHVDPILARELLSEAGESCTAAEAHDPWLIRGRLSQLVGAKLNVSGSLEATPGKQQVVAMVGPTGVGKTTTLAKIAAGFRFDVGSQVGLITLDTFRLGAVDQLLQYAELISAPLEVVSSPDQVGNALQRLQQCDLVLLDTAGRAPRDAEQLSVLSDFLRCAKPDATHLVLSATSSVAHAEEAWKQFSVLQPSNLLITKLDEAVGFGSWLSFLRQSNLPISYLTTGQHVPQDIIVASTRRLASLLLTNGQQQGQAV